MFMARDETTIAQTFTEYIQAFQTLNPRASFPEFSPQQKEPL
jgi:hypothetical protein